ncbi:MAG: serine hydrolase [Acidimicrobiia bacterium]|nr:serine hydrolase [Acidimicrobiia bacterium]
MVSTVRRWSATACVVTAAMLCASVVAVGAADVPDGSAPVSAWPVVPAETHNMDPDVLEGARTYAFVPTRNTQGVVVVRHGDIVAEWYAEDRDQDSWATSWSIAKSFASALVGIAIDEGLIAGVDVPMTDYYPEWEGTTRETMTLRHVLTMSSGLDWSESYNPSTAATSNIIRMVAQELDQLAYVRSIEADATPGTRFRYSSGDSMLLSGVIEQATGMPAHEYAQDKLFDPLGIDQIEQWRDAVGNTLTYCCVDTTTRGFARFGQLYLQDGRWGDEQVVPSSWVAASVTPSATSAGYGYQWWLNSVGGIPYFSARGHDGQFVYVVPSLDLVVARNGTYHKADAEPIADPNLFVYIPPQNLIPGSGTVGPSSWSDGQFLAPIIDSIDDPDEVTYTARYSGQSCAFIVGFAAGLGMSPEEMIRMGVEGFRGVADAGGATPQPTAPANDEGDCEFDVVWHAGDDPALQAAADAWGVSVGQLHHGGGLVVVRLIYRALLAQQGG